MQPRGIDFLCPISELIEKKHDHYYHNKPKVQGLDLSGSQVITYYTTYINDAKRPLEQNEVSVRVAVRKKLTPGNTLKIQNFELKIQF